MSSSPKCIARAGILPVPERAPAAGASGPRRATKDCHILVGASTLVAGNGGIGRVGRMSIKALVDAGYRTSIASFLDKQPEMHATGTAAAFGGSKFRFMAHILANTDGATHFLYDTLGPARAHPRFAGLRRPSAVWIHGIEVWENLRRDHLRTLHRADMVLVNSQTTLDRHQSIHGELSRARVCWLGTEADSPPDQGAAFEGPPTVLMLARVVSPHNQKGHAEVLAAWPAVIAAVPSARLVFAGGGPGLDELKALARSSPARGNIDVLGFVAEDRISELFRAAHVFAMPSRKEGFGIVYAEAMRFGIPVIASDLDAGKEVNVDGVTGYNVNLDRQGDLPDRLIALLRDPAHAAMLGQNGLRRWHEHFSFPSFERRFLSLIEDFVS